MNLKIKVELCYNAEQPGDLLLQIEAAQTSDQKILSNTLTFNPGANPIRIMGDEGVGERIWVSVSSTFECSYSATVALSREEENISELHQTPLNHLPGNAVKFLMPSRYCHPEDFQIFAAKQFEGLQGGAFISAASYWIKSNFEYVNDASDSSTTASDTLQTKKGVCRDYAHVLIALARSVAIPARIVSAYAPDVRPQDFHAVVEVFLDGKWQLVDPTGMAKQNEIIRIGVGADASDVSFMTSYTLMQLKTQSVKVARL